MPAPLSSSSSSSSSSSPPEQVGAPDPDRETSPIVGEEDRVEAEPDARPGACLFNGRAFRVGAWVRSGAEVLRCEPPGVWVSKGELPPGGRVLD